MLDPARNEESDAYAQFSSGSAITPGSFGGSQPKEMAPPNAKVKAVVNRNKHQEIWTEQDLQEEVKDDRPAPDYDILYKQDVGAQDVFLNVQDRDPSTVYCDLLVKIHLPDTTMADITIDVEKQLLKLQAPNYRLNLPLPYPVKDKEGNAKWDKKDETLNVTLPIERELPVP